MFNEGCSHEYALYKSWNHVEAESRILEKKKQMRACDKFSNLRKVIENMWVFVGGQILAKFIHVYMTGAQVNLKTTQVCSLIRMFAKFVHVERCDGFTNITGAQVNLQTTQVYSTLGMRSVTPNNLPILKQILIISKGVQTH